MGRKLIATGLLSAFAGAACMASTGQISATPVATINGLNNATQAKYPYIDAYNVTTSTSGTGTLVSFNQHIYSQLTIYNTSKSNFTTTGGVAVDVQNPTGADENFVFAVTDGINTYQNSFLVHANTKESVALLFNTAGVAAKYGLNVLPNPYQGIAYAEVPWTSNAVNLSNVKSVYLAPLSVGSVSSLQVTNVRLLPSVNWDNLLQSSVDSFGQTAITSWQGKLANAGQLATWASAEQSTFTKIQGNNVDAYGGAITLPNQGATGHFRVAKVNGKWWFVDPLGYLFYMQGVDQVAVSDGATMVSGRSGVFQSLPSTTSAYGQFYSTVTVNGVTGAAYNFYGSNLYQKYGSSYQSTFTSTLVKRFQTWGLNTLGEFSDANVAASANIPYILSIGIQGNCKTVNPGNPLWRQMYDPYDPQFAAALATQSKQWAKLAQNPYLIGIVFDNEASWVGATGKATDSYGIGIGTMALSATSSPAKAELVSEMTAKYTSIASLNRAWGTSFTNWTQFGAAYSFSGTPSTAAQADLLNFVGNFAKKYYSQVQAAVKAANPNLLFLGNSYSTARISSQILSVAANYVDAMAVNTNSQGVAPFYNYLGAIDKPVMINEIALSSNGEGIPFPSAPYLSQSQRAAAYTAYMTKNLADPRIVGGSFYKYIDSMVTGQGDGECDVNGLVDVTDTPYSPMVSAIQNIATTMYVTRYN